MEAQVLTCSPGIEELVKEANRRHWGWRILKVSDRCDGRAWILPSGAFGSTPGYYTPRSQDTKTKVPIDIDEKRDWLAVKREILIEYIGHPIEEAPDEDGKPAAASREEQLTELGTNIIAGFIIGVIVLVAVVVLIATVLAVVSAVVAALVAISPFLALAGGLLFHNDPSLVCVILEDGIYHYIEVGRWSDKNEQNI